MNVSLRRHEVELEMMAFSSSGISKSIRSPRPAVGLKADLHEVLDGLLLLIVGKHVDPQNVVVTQLVEELRVGITDNLVVLLEVNRNHKTLSFLKFIILFGREADDRPLNLGGIGPRRHLDAGVPELCSALCSDCRNIVDIR
ncbi:MAG: hypothetical protein ACLTSJ_09900 [Alistipes communis]